MSVELAIILGFLFHLCGDYLLQNDWMANNKAKNSLAALIHAQVYSMLFLIVCWSPMWFVILITHFFIDRFRLAVYWIRLVNAVKLHTFNLWSEAELLTGSMHSDGLNHKGEDMPVFKIVSIEGRGDEGIGFNYESTYQVEGTPFGRLNLPGTENFGYWNKKPPYIAFWLMVIIDNTFHLLINTACIYFHFKYFA